MQASGKKLLFAARSFPYRLLSGPGRLCGNRSFSCHPWNYVSGILLSPSRDPAKSGVSQYPEAVCFFFPGIFSLRELPLLLWHQFILLVTLFPLVESKALD